MMGENTMFDVLRYIRECFGIFHVEGDEAVFEDVTKKVGLAKQNYNSLERGARPISMLMSKKLADALGTSYLMFFRENKSKL
jgi:transcriptional regulator with XRE-family HTH domain